MARTNHLGAMGSYAAPEVVAERSDSLTARFHDMMSASPSSGADRHLMERALAYAREAENRIMELNERVHRLEALSQTDELTGLLNRRGFQDILHRNLMSAARYHETGVLAFIDLDGFKAVNDEHGHAAGDEVLRAVGAYLKRSVRATDFAARLGGDEFALIFVRADIRPARERARDIVRGINSLKAVYSNVELPVRASLGTATYHGETDGHDLMDRADRAMYRAKKQRPRIVPFTMHE
ncbi:GGDEF domain-containing protein [Parvibaculum sp.]|uniref:GGDEF domain-containing protein n=1 Tax=Parvibaculum sp. TaxID=2024848 RepID=UPI0025F2023E|nr:GGDEF domain-containing protein [Parvibaculum sp.]|tara:strand:- start:151 stop:867 length:717 start_codon:yes stop_codon:yes gene_type:complete